MSAGQGQKAADAGLVACPTLMFGTVPDANIATYPVIPGEDQSNTAPDPDRDGVRLHYNSDKPSQLSVDKADITTLYSIPRLSIMFFPNF